MSSANLHIHQKKNFKRIYEKNINQTVNDGVAHSKNPRKCAYHMTFDLYLDLEHNLDASLPGDHRVQVWLRSGRLPGRKSDFRASTKVPVSRDLWPWPWAHPGCKLTWSPSCESLVAIRPFAWEKKRFAQKFTDRRTDRRQTPRHCISSFLEWANTIIFLAALRFLYINILKYHYFRTGCSTFFKWKILET